MKTKKKKFRKKQLLTFNFYGLEHQKQDWLIDQIDDEIYIKRLHSYYNTEDPEKIKQYLKSAVKDKLLINNLIENLRFESEFDLQKLILKLYPNFYNNKIIVKLGKRLKKKL